MDYLKNGSTPRRGLRLLREFDFIRTDCPLDPDKGAVPWPCLNMCDLLPTHFQWNTLLLEYQVCVQSVWKKKWLCLFHFICKYPVCCFCVVVFSSDLSLIRLSDSFISYLSNERELSNLFIYYLSKERERKNHWQHFSFGGYIHTVHWGIDMCLYIVCHIVCLKYGWYWS